MMVIHFVNHHYNRIYYLKNVFNFTNFQDSLSCLLKIIVQSAAMSSCWLVENCPIALINFHTNCRLYGFWPGSHKRACMCAPRQHTHTGPGSPPPTHPLRATHVVRSELVHMKQLVSDFVEEQWKQSFCLVTAASGSEGWFVSCLSFCVLLHSVLTLTNKHSSLVISTWSVHKVYLVFVWFAPEFMKLHLYIIQNYLSMFCVRGE